MWAKHLLTFVALCAAPAAAQSGPLLKVLQDNGFTKYAELLQAQSSRVLTAGSGLIVYVPTNAAINLNGNTAVARRATDAADAAGLYGAVDKSAPRFPKIPKPGNGTTRRLARDLGCTPGFLYESLLNDPAWVNLGPGHNQTLVEKHVSSVARPVVLTGLGRTVKVTASDIPFDRGVIRPISGVLTLPRLLSETLPVLGAERFQNALQQAGLLNDLDNRATITVFAPTDSSLPNSVSLTGAQLRQHIVVGFPAYTPLVADGDVYPTLAGGSVVVSVRDGIISVNGAQIQAGDAIIENGVVHTIDKMLTAPTTTTSSGVSTVPTAAATTAKPPSWQPLVLTLVATVMAAVAGQGIL